MCGLLIKKTITKKNDFHCDGLFMRMNREPFLIGKIVKLQNSDHADDYLSKPANYNKAQVPGFKIFIIEAGFTKKPQRVISEFEICNTLEEMCNWYAEHIVQANRSMTRTYKVT